MQFHGSVVGLDPYPIKFLILNGAPQLLNENLYQVAEIFRGRHPFTFFLVKEIYLYNFDSQC